METNADFVEKQREIGRRRYQEKKQRELANGVEPKRRGRPPKYHIVVEQD
jgi:ribosomal protein S8E